MSELEEQQKAPIPLKAKAKVVSAQTGNDELKQSLERRRKEFIHVRLDMIERLSEKIESYPVRMEKMRTEFDLMNETYEKFVLSLERIETLNDSAWDDENYSNELAVAQKELENHRLEFLKLQAKINEVCRLAAGEVSSPQLNGTSRMQALTELPFGELVKFSFAVSLPLIITIGVSAFFLIIAILFFWKV